jgi:capsular polysaccharide export protein
VASDLSDRPRSFLFLQGPLSPLYARLAGQIEAAGHRVSRINLCPGDWLHWRRPGAVDYRGTPADWPEFVRREMAARAVTDVILHGDRRPYHAAAVTVAHKRGARVFVTELGYLRPDWMTLERDAAGAASHFSRDPAVIEWLAVQSRPLDLVPRYQAEFAKVAIPDVAYNLANTLLRVLYPHYQRHTIYFPPLEYAAWLVRLATRPLRDRAATGIAQEIAQHERVSFVFALQLEGDFQIRAAARGGLTGALDEVVGSFATHAPEHTLLVVKSHPLDNGLERWRRVLRDLGRRHGVAARLRFADGGTLEPLLARASGFISVNSNAGIEALRAGVPVKTLAPAVYDVPGLVHAGPLETFWQSPQKPDQRLLGLFLRALAGHTQVRGTIYSDAGLIAAVNGMAERILADTGAAGAYRPPTADGTPARASDRRQ